MDDIPQPASNPYTSGDRARVYLSSDDPDSAYHGVEVEIVDVHTDNLDRQTGRGIDRYSYRVRRVDNNEIIDVQFRHADLVPAD